VSLEEAVRELVEPPDAEFATVRILYVSTICVLILICDMCLDTTILLHTTIYVSSCS
jgi:hypothetical protein